MWGCLTPIILLLFPILLVAMMTHGAQGDTVGGWDNFYSSLRYRAAPYPIVTEHRPRQWRRPHREFRPPNVNPDPVLYVDTPLGLFEFPSRKRVDLGIAGLWHVPMPRRVVRSERGYSWRTLDGVNHYREELLPPGTMEKVAEIEDTEFPPGELLKIIEAMPWETRRRPIVVWWQVECLLAMGRRDEAVDLFASVGDDVRAAVRADGSDFARLIEWELERTAGPFTERYLMMCAIRDVQRGSWDQTRAHPEDTPRDVAIMKVLSLRDLFRRSDEVGGGFPSPPLLWGEGHLGYHASIILEMEAIQLAVAGDWAGAASAIEDLWRQTPSPPFIASRGTLHSRGSNMKIVMSLLDQLFYNTDAPLDVLESAWPSIRRLADAERPDPYDISLLELERGFSMTIAADDLSRPTHWALYTDVTARMAALAVRVRTYRTLHGAWPDTSVRPSEADLPLLHEAADYSDPFDPAGGEIRWLVDGAGDFRLYSMGPNRLDDGGVIGDEVYLRFDTQMPWYSTPPAVPQGDVVHLLMASPRNRLHALRLANDAGDIATAEQIAETIVMNTASPYSSTPEPIERIRTKMGVHLRKNGPHGYCTAPHPDQPNDPAAHYSMQRGLKSPGFFFVPLVEGSTDAEPETDADSE